MSRMPKLVQSWLIKVFPDHWIVPATISEQPPVPEKFPRKSTPCCANYSAPVRRELAVPSKGFDPAPQSVSPKNRMPAYGSVVGASSRSVALPLTDAVEPPAR